LIYDVLCTYFPHYYYVFRNELFAYPINWATLDAQNVAEEVMRPWVATKIAEFLGEEEESLIEFVVTSIRSHCKPAELLEELSSVLDEEGALPFVLKMWRMLAFYSVKGQEG
jgi:RNA-binding protein 25